MDFGLFFGRVTYFVKRFLGLADQMDGETADFVGQIDCVQASVRLELGRRFIELETACFQLGTSRRDIGGTDGDVAPWFRGKGSS